MKLNVDEDFRNDSLFYFNSQPLVKDKMDIEQNDTIPFKIKSEFECDDSICQKLINNIQFIYDIIGKTLYITNQEETVSYDIVNKFFIYNKSLSKFTVENGNISCDEYNCNEARKIYDYYMNYIKKYI